MDDKDWRVDVTHGRCGECQYKDLCNKRAFILEIIKIFATPKMIFAVLLGVLTIVQFIIGGS